MKRFLHSLAPFVLAGMGLLLSPASPEPPGGVMVVMAHPDDELHFAGTLLQAAEAGHPVHMVYATSGDDGSDRSGRGLSGEALARERERECREALRILGAREPIFLRIPDGEVLRNQRRLVKELLGLLDRIQPDVVITLGFNGITAHPDHIGASNAAGVAVQRVPRGPRLLHAVYSTNRARKIPPQWNVQPVDPSHVTHRVDTSGTEERRLSILRRYPTQFDGEAVELLRSLVLPEDRVEEFIEVGPTEERFLRGVPTLP